MTSHDQNKSWFLAQLKPNCAQIADKNLQRQGLETFLPLQEETRPRNGKFVTEAHPLFPGYIFVTFDVRQGLWRRINATYGVGRLVSFGQTPAEVPRGLIEGLRQRCDGTSKLLPPSTFAPGDQVRLTSGPFVNFVAEVETIDPDQRIWVLMDLMGAKTRVAVDGAQMRAV